MGDIFEGFPNESTGLVPQFYAFLWSKNNLLQTRCQHHKCPLIVIPDTIVLEGRQPTFWYFTSLKTGTMQRRSKDIDMEAACEILQNKSDPGLDVVASLIDLKRGHFQPAVHYLTQALLAKYCSAGSSKSSLCSVLQVYNQPKGTSNFVIRVEWTRDEVRMDSCININKLSDMSLPVPDRTSTSDDRNCVMIPLHGNVLAEQLSNMSACITDHIQFISGNRFSVGRMVCNYRIDSSDRVWLLWCETLDLIDNTRVAPAAVVPRVAITPDPLPASRKQQPHQPQRSKFDYASGAGYTSFESGAEDRNDSVRHARIGHPQSKEKSRYELRPESQDSANSFTSSIQDSRFESMAHPSSAERVEMSSREQPTRVQHANKSFFNQDWSQNDTDGAHDDAVSIENDFIQIGIDSDPFFPSHVVSPRESSGHFMLLSSQFGDNDVKNPPEKKKKQKPRHPAFVKPRSTTPSEDEAQHAELPGESDLESAPYVDAKVGLRSKSMTTATSKPTKNTSKVVEEESLAIDHDKDRKKQLRAKQAALEAAKQAQEAEVLRAEKLRVKEERAKERERARVAQEREKEEEKKRALETLREQAKLENAQKREAFEKKKSGSNLAKASRDSKLKEETSLEQSKRKTIPRKVPGRADEIDQEAISEHAPRHSGSRSPSRADGQNRENSPSTVVREATPNPYDEVGPTELLMSAFGPPSPASVVEAPAMIPVVEQEVSRELHPDYEGRKMNAQAAAAAAAAEAAAAAAVAAQAAASAHTAAAAEEAAVAATQAAALATAAAVMATAESRLPGPLAARTNLQPASMPAVEAVPPVESIASPRVAPWLQEARSSVKDLTASPAQHKHFLEFSKEPGLEDEYLPSPDIRKSIGIGNLESSDAQEDVIAERDLFPSNDVSVLPSNSAGNEGVVSGLSLASSKTDLISQDGVLFEDHVSNQFQQAEIGSAYASSTANAHSLEEPEHPSPSERTAGRDESDSRYSDHVPAEFIRIDDEDTVSNRTGVEAAARFGLAPLSREAADKGSVPADRAEQSPGDIGSLVVKSAGESSDFSSVISAPVANAVIETIARDLSSIPLPSLSKRDEYEDSIIDNDANIRNMAPQERTAYSSSVSATAHALANPFSQSIASVARQTGEAGRDAISSVSSIKSAPANASFVAPDREEIAPNPTVGVAGGNFGALPQVSDDRLIKAPAEAVDELVYNPELMSEPGSHVPGSGLGRHRSGMGYGKRGMVSFEDAREALTTPFGIHNALKIKEPPSQQKIGALTTTAQGVVVDPRVALSDMSALPPRVPTRLELNTSKLLSADPCVSTPSLREPTQAQVNAPADCEDDVEFLVVDEAGSGALHNVRPSTSSGRMDTAEDKCTSERPVSVLGNRPKGRMAPNQTAKLGADDDSLKGNLPPLPPQEETAHSLTLRSSVDSHSTLGPKMKGKEVRARDSTVESTGLPIPIRRTVQSADVHHHSENPDLPPTESEKKSLYDGMLGVGEEADLDTLKLIFKANKLTGAERSRKSGRETHQGVGAPSHESLPTLSAELGGESEDHESMRQSQWMPRECFPGGRQKGLQHVDVPTVSRPWGAQNISDGPAPPSPVKKQPDKVRGINVDRAREAVKDRCLDGHKKDDNWAFDEFAQGQEQALNAAAGGAGIPAGGPATLELKFDCTFDDDDSRLAFAERQRAILAQMLGVPVSEIEVENAKPGSPVTIVKFKLASQGVRSVQSSSLNAASDRSADSTAMFERQPIGAAVQGGSAGSALMARVQSGLPNITVLSRDASLSESTAALKQSLKVSSTEDDIVRHIVVERSKSIESSGNSDSAVANVAGDKSSSSEQDSARLGKAKVPGMVVPSEHSADLHEDSSARPSRAVDPAQFSSTCKDKKSGRNKDRLKLHQEVSQFAVEVPLKVPNLEVPDTLRVKEAELELEALPAARAEEAPRAGALVRKAEGVEDARDLAISEYERRFEERTKTLSELAPSLQLSKSAEDGVYALPQKVFGDENAKTRLPSEPSGISTGDRNQKRKGKDAQKVELAAVPEHYMAFGTEGESQRLPVDAAAVEAPTAVVPPERPPPGASAKHSAGASALLAASALAASASPSKVGKKVDFGDSMHSATRASLQVTSNKATFDFPEGVDSKSSTVKQPQDGFEEEDIGSSNPIQSVQKRLPRKAAAKSHLLTRIHSIESTLQRLYSKLETEADVVADIGEFEEGVEKNATSVKTPSNQAARNLALALLDERDAPVVQSRHDEYENQSGGPRSARAKMVSSSRVSGQSVASGSVAASGGAKVGISAYDHPVFEPKVVEKGPLDSSTPTEANEEDLLAQIVRERDIRRARLENRRVGGNQTADDDELIQPALSSASAPIKVNASAKEVSFSSPSGYTVKSSAAVTQAAASASATKPASKVDSNRLEASVVHSPAPVEAEASPAPAKSQSLGSSMAGGLKGAVKASLMLSMGSGGGTSSTNPPADDDYVADSGGKTSVPIPDGGNPLTQEEQSEYLLWKNVFSAVRHGRRNEVISSLEAGCPVDIRDTAGNTLCIIAAQNGNKNMCKALLRRGADINAANHRGQVSLHFCYQYGFADLAAYLVSKGADDTIQNIFGKTPQEGLE